MTGQVQATSQQFETQACELTSDELEHVSGGGETVRGGLLIGLADGSVRNVDASSSDYAVWRNRYGPGL